VVSSLLQVWVYRATVVNTPFRETHYGPPDHAVYAGKTLRLAVKIEVKDWVPDFVRCGLEADGAPLPRPGPLTGEQVDWDSADLAQYGSVTFDPAGGVTDKSGISTLLFTPRTEVVPNFGTLYKRTGQVTASGLSAGGLPIFYNVSQDWTVTFHKPRGFQFTMPTITFVNTAPDKTKTVLPVNISGRVCGDDPYTVPWTINESIKGIPAAYKVALPDGIPVTSAPNSDFPHTWTLVDQGNGDLEASVTITPGAPFSGTFDPPSASAKVRVTEDKSCPDNSASG
jgi:hypothetical protein